LPRYCNHTDPRGSNVPFQRGSNYSVTWRPRGYHVHLLAGILVDSFMVSYYVL